MTNLNLYTSNRLEILAKKLAGILSHPLSSPMEPEIIVVQSKGMERWISMELAQRLGIAANILFPFPNALIYEVIGKLIPGIPDPSPFDAKIMAWKIMKLQNQLVLGYQESAIGPIDFRLVNFQSFIKFLSVTIEA